LALAAGGNAGTVSDEQLRSDLRALGDRFHDEEFSTELYRALASRKWRKASSGEPVAPSWSRAEQLVNDLRAQVGEEPLELAQSGGEGELSRVVDDELGRLGWTSEPLDTSEHDESHVSSPESPPPPDTGARHAPVDDPGAWRREAHAEAEAERLRETEVPRRPP
jgi:hypothetical protein